ncbi:MAG TPA: PDDEXK nuclease domain-containing protein [Candidatus Ozemobacteraceae bacterium]|nr:PDDEXK nuclease domain-containing protein [Candidatus Ozemobacteraceae bacterium]
MLLSSLREIIAGARQQALKAADLVQVRTCWTIGRHIVEFEQGGSARAGYGKRLLAELAENLTVEFGRGFDERNLRHMRAFYLAFPIWNAMRTELSWTHYRSLLRVEDEAAREWYMNEAASENWNTRALDRQISTLYYERLLASKDRQPVRDEATRNIAALSTSPRDFIRDPVLLEFLGLPGSGKLLESKLEDALLNNLQAFLLELGKGFAFVARQKCQLLSAQQQSHRHKTMDSGTPSGKRSRNHRATNINYCRQLTLPPQSLRPEIKSASFHFFLQHLDQLNRVYF